MRPIHIARLDKSRPAVVLTRELVRPHLTSVTIAPITSSVRGISTEIPVGPANGLEIDSVINCDNILTISTSDLGKKVGVLLPEQEIALAEAIFSAFDLEF